MLQKVVRQGGKGSFAEASADLRELCDLKISPTHVQRLTERVGREWQELRHREVAAFRAGKLAVAHRNKHQAAAVFLDGGRLQTRADDAGRGVTVRLYQLGISSGKGIDAVFLTHYHSDHVAGLPDLWMTGYEFGPFGSRAKPTRLWGPSDGTTEPSGAAKIAKGLAEAFSDDIRIRRADDLARVINPIGGAVCAS